MCGWETGSIQQLGATSQSYTAPSVATSAPAPRSGGYYLKCSRVSGSTANSFCWLNVAHAVNSELFYAFGMYRDPVDALSGSPSLNCFRVLDAAGNVNLVLTCEIDGSMRAYVATGGTTAPTTANLTLLGTSTTSVSSLAWHLIEVHAIAATGATGALQVRLDGATVINLTSVRTCQTTASFGQFQVGLFAYVAGGNGALFAFDDLRVNTPAGTINNSWCGDGKILGLLPNGVGATIGGTPLTGVPGSPNWQNVDEVPASVADYNYGSVAGTGELYTLADTTGIVTSCAAVNLIGYALNSDAGGGSVGFTMQTSGAANEAAATPITATATYYNRLMETDPTDNAAWTQAKLNALQAGITVR